MEDNRKIKLKATTINFVNWRIEITHRRIPLTFSQINAGNWNGAPKKSAKNS